MVDPGSQTMIGPDLETRVKAVVTGLTFCLTVILIAMSLSIDFHETYLSEQGKIDELSSRSSDLTSRQVMEIIDREGEAWRITSEGDGTSVTTSDGASWKVSLNGKHVLTSILHRRRHLLVAGMICLLLSAEMAVFLAYWLTRPLKRLAWGCAKVGRGDLSDLPVERSGSYELEILQKAFNAMVRGLRERQSLERRISRMERLAALGQVVAGVSHEIKNPLAAMRIHLDLLSGARSGETEDEESLQVLSSELDRLNRVVTQLLSFARPTPTVPGPIEPRELFRWCHSMVRVRLSRKSIGWHEAVDDGTELWGDRGQMQQLLLNLVLNGIEAMDEEGDLYVSCRRSGKGTSMSVEDTGGGVPDRVAERIFDPFVTSKPDGTGLGLSIVYRIVEDHRGTMDLKTSSEGTRLDLWFPGPTEKGNEEDKI
jgi:signal transduction histidine kinase